MGQTTTTAPAAARGSIVWSMLAVGSSSTNQRREAGREEGEEKEGEAKSKKLRKSRWDMPPQSGRPQRAGQEGETGSPETGAAEAADEPCPATAPTIVGAEGETGGSGEEKTGHKRVVGQTLQLQHLGLGPDSGCQGGKQPGQSRELPPDPATAQMKGREECLHTPPTC